MKNKLIAVDLDGTMIDTMPVNYESYRMALEENGYSVTPEIFREKCFGSYYRNFLPILMPEADEKEIIRIHERKKELYPSCASSGRRNDMLYELICSLRSTGEWYSALVTTGNRKNTMEILSAFGCLDIFDVILANEDVEKSKPDPEGYLKAMEMFNVTPENTLIFEDSKTGIAAAKASGAVVAVVDLYS